MGGGPRDKTAQIMSDSVSKISELKIEARGGTGSIICLVANIEIRGRCAAKAATTTARSLETENGEACMLHHTEIDK